MPQGPPKRVRALSPNSCQMPTAIPFPKSCPWALTAPEARVCAVTIAALMNFL